MKLTYSIYEAKAKLSEILRAVRKGRRITITDRGREVAKIVPMADDDVDRRIADLVAEGILSPASDARLPGLSIGQPRPGAFERFLRERD